MQSNKVLLMGSFGMHFLFFFNLQYAAFPCVGPDSGLKVSTELVASIQSIAAFLQHRMEADGPNNSCPDQLDSNTQQGKKSKVSKLLHRSACADF